MDTGDQHRDAEASLDKGPGRLVTNSARLAQAEIDRHQHQAGAVCERDRERPEPELRWRYPG